MYLRQKQYFFFSYRQVLFILDGDVVCFCFHYVAFTFLNWFFLYAFVMFFLNFNEFYIVIMGKQTFTPRVPCSYIIEDVH